MRIGTVIGTVTLSERHPSLAGGSYRVVVPLSLSVEFNYAPPYWLHLVLWLPLTLGMAIGLLTPVKGAVVGLQWAFRMHGFGGNADDGLAIVPVTTAANTNESK